MFLEFYGLRQQPFGVTPDPSYLYRSATHNEALCSLSSGIREGRGFFALVAQPGMGKTTLLYQLMEELRDTARIAYLFQTQCDIREFLQYLLTELHVDARGLGLVALHNKLNEALFGEMLEGKRFVLIVDEAQNLDDPVLETVRLLSNFETTHTKLLQIVLAGQPELAAKLEHPRLLQLRQRIAVMSHLERLSAEDTAGYINHRLRVAGYSGDGLFTTSAIQVIAESSRGIPRNINNVCFHALSLASSRRANAVDESVARETAAKLGFAIALASPVHVGHSAEASPSPRLAPAPEVAAAAHEPPAPANMFARALTYRTSSPFAQSRWALAAVAAMVLVVFGASARTIWKLASPSLTRAASMPKASPDAANAPPGFATEFGSANFAAAPQQSPSGQVLTVVAQPGQTIKDICVMYAGSYTPATLAQIQRLNPLLDPNRIEAGQLVRVPVAQGTWKKSFDSDDTFSNASSASTPALPAAPKQNP